MNFFAELVEQSERLRYLPTRRLFRSETRVEQIARLRYLAWLWLAGGVAMAIATKVCFHLGARLGTAGFVYLIIIVLLSLMDSFVTSAVFSITAVGCLAFFFTQPIFTFRVGELRDLAALIAFLTTSLIITTLVRRVRWLGKAAREQARLLDLSHDTVFVRDMNAVITYWNHGAEELYGWKKAEALGKTSHQLLQTRFPVSLDDTMNTLLTTGRWEGELIHTTRDGSQVVVLSRWSLQRSANGRPISALETNNDITLRKRAEDALRRNQAAYLAEAQKLSLTGSFGWDPASGEIFWSEQSFRIFGYDLDVTPTVELTLQRVYSDDVALFRQVIDKATSGEQEFDCEYRLLMPDKSIKHLHVVAHVVTDEPGKRRFVGAIMDVTAAKLAAQKLHEAQTELARVTRVTTLGELSASIAHEVSQPLAAIVTNGEACLRWLGHPSPELAEVQNCVTRMIGEGRRASDIVHHIRTLAKKDFLQKTRLDLNDVIHDVVGLTQREVLSHKVSLCLRLASELPPLLGDRVQLQQVIINLMMNGIQSMDGIHGRPRDLLIESYMDQGGNLVVAVQDSGSGIDPENADRLFDAFFTTKPNGLGMGLSICQSIVEAHGGRMSAASRPGHGATFQFGLPAIIERSDDARAQSEFQGVAQSCSAIGAPQHPGPHSHGTVSF
ncbi:PAS domain S-box-containing protein [Paraburkholderia sp. BL6669N2]|uniref:ATP-binding protein n=1 Tax=Paraburkholderia sp. BL6669N2 TaxID=1938807 RepID=UPI000E267D81|nr:ATP-binding protein [Paraburkholderia sp. BL6669N2]REG50694.1 PAS domain S-box-containing protein [Paraburkholderia sp. BL6669N2]